jgi:phosphohistidine phosphatase
MRILLMQRHAQAESGAAYARDFDRELTDSGRRDAKRLGAHLSDIDQVPPYVLSSAAVRARETAQYMLEGAQAEDTEVTMTDALYQAAPEQVLNEIRSLTSGVSTAYLVGHQPAWGAVIQRLTGAQVDMRTGAIACIQLPVRSWSQVKARSGRLVWFLPPMAV